MRLDVVPDNILERLVLLMGIVPTPVVQVSWGMASASTIIAGSRLGLFDALDGEELDAEQLASKLGTHPLATETLLNALCGFGCVDRSDGRYRNSAPAAKWLVRSSKDSLHDAVLLLGLIQDGFHDLENVVRTGKILDWHHGGHGAEVWEPYLRGLGKLAKLPAGEVARRVKLGPEARRLLDVGGGHGQWSTAFCRRHPELEATVLDLPPAVPVGEAIVAEAGMAGRVRYRAGDLRTAEWGEGWDCVLIFNVIHNLSPEECQAAVERAKGALKPGGRLVILEAEHRHVRDRINQAAAFAEIMCFMTSGTRAYPEAQMRAWVEAAGFAGIKTWRPRFGPYMVVIEGMA
jgi:ubiquinone/menaquinone biosynthesis C-methylase UbiE